MSELIDNHTIVSAEEWKDAHDEMLVKEKKYMRAGDALAAERRRMPWTEVTKDYTFIGPDGEVSLEGLFDGRRQLIVYRAFYGESVTTLAEGSEYPDRACVGCSMVADHVVNPAHIAERDTSLAFVSSAPIDEIEGLKERHGWEHIPWYELTDDFDKDHDVDQWHGHNVFLRDEDRIFRTYWIHDRGDERMGSVWSYLDITPLGRQEKWEDSDGAVPRTDPYQWWNYHDNYGGAAFGRNVASPPAARSQVIVLAHISGFPVEELAPLAGTSLVAVGTWIRARLPDAKRRKASNTVGR